MAFFLPIGHTAATARDVVGYVIQSGSVVMQGIEILNFDITQYRGTCTLMSDSKETLESLAVRNFVLQEAQSRGLSRAGLSGAPEVYPVGPEGEPLNPMKASPGALRYKGVYKVAGGL